MGRSIEEETKLLDEIVGRCVREPEFGRRVLLDPKTALAEYDASEGLVDDFRALAEHGDETLRDWLRLRKIVFKE
jgi:hypothetical protein